MRPRSPDQFLGEAGSIYPFAPARTRRSADDSRMSIEERYTSREQYLGKIAIAARQLVAGGFLLAAANLPDLIDQAATYL